MSFQGLGARRPLGNVGGSVLVGVLNEALLLMHVLELVQDSSLNSVQGEPDFSVCARVCSPDL